MIYVLTLKHHNETYTVFKKPHTYEHRKYGSHPRDFFINTKRYKEIVGNVLKWGLTSFRNKGVVKVQVQSHKTLISLLVTLNENNRIEVHTVLYTPLTSIDGHFKNVRQKIYLSLDKYIYKQLSAKEVKQQELNYLKY